MIVYWTIRLNQLIIVVLVTVATVVAAAVRVAVADPWRRPFDDRLKQGDQLLLHVRRERFKHAAM
jgi:hypothetical protein